MVSAQNRQRFYAHNWGCPQPEDRGILLKDILEDNVNDSIDFTNRPENSRKRILRKIQNGKSRTLTASSWKGIESDGMPIVTELLTPFVEGKLQSIVDKFGYLPEHFNAYNKSEITDKSPTLTACANRQSNSAQVMNVLPVECFELDDEYFKGGYDGNLVGQIVNNGKYKNGKQPSQQYRVYTLNGKSICVDADQRKYYVCPATGEEQIIYQIKNGLITIKDKQYLIKLADGFYIIRKLTPIECERLQTLPDNYTEGISNSQRYKCIGNGWTAEAIIHQLRYMNIPLDEEIQVLSMYDGIATGRYCFDKLGYKNITYYSYEIDKYAMQVAMKNYSDIIQCGDAFKVRENEWKV